MRFNYTEFDKLTHYIDIVCLKDFIETQDSLKEDLSDWLASSFTWNSTEEGYVFWDILHSKLELLCRKKQNTIDLQINVMLDYLKDTKYVIKPKSLCYEI